MTSAVAGILASLPRRRRRGPFVQAAATPPTPPPVDLSDPYATLALGVGSGPIRFWRFDDVSAADFRCSITGTNGTYPAVPAVFDVPQLPTTTTGGGGVLMGGTGYANGVYDAIEATAAAEGCLSIWIKPTADDIANERWFAAKGNVSNDTPGRGRMLLRVFADGNLRAFWRNGTESSVTLTIVGVITAGSTYHVANLWSPSGVTLIVNGTLEDTSAAHTIGLANNTEPWQFGARNNVTPFALSYATFDEAPLYAGPITIDEIRLLADYVAPISSDDVGLAPAALYQPYTKGGDTVDVGSIAALQTAVNAAPPGRVIRLLPGTYTGGTFSFNPVGTQAAPVIITARDGYGSVEITAPTWTFTGSRFVIEHLQFTNANIRFDGSGQFARVTRCKFSDINTACCDIYGFKNFRVDRCDASGYRSTTDGKHFLRMRHTNVSDGTLQNVLVDRNYCHSVNPSVGQGATEWIGLTSSGPGAGPDSAAAQFPGFFIERNLFDGITLTGDGELIGAKTSGIVFWRNTITNCGTALYINAPREAQQFNLLESWFENNSQSRIVRLASYRSRAIGNRFVGSGNIDVGHGRTYWPDPDRSVLPVYRACDECQIVGNIMGSGFIRVGDAAWDASEVPARNNNLWANTRDSGDPAYTIDGANSIGTTFNNPGISYTPAVKLTTADVGPLGLEQPQQPPAGAVVYEWDTGGIDFMDSDWSQV